MKAMNLKRILAVFLLTAIMAAFLPLQTLALEAGGFSVMPVLPENQNPATKGYFDLTVTPGQIQDLAVRITNKLDDEITVTVNILTASTNQNGLVNYTSEGLMDESLVYAIADLADALDHRITIPAKGSAETTIRLSVPEEAFSGSLLGSIQVTRELTEEELNSGDMILNQYSFVLGLKLTQEGELPGPDFALGQVIPELTNYKASVVHHIRNTQPVLVKDITISAQVTAKKDGALVFEKTKEGAEMAPNSIYPFILEDDAGQGLEAGTYISTIRMEQGGEIWEFEREFVVEPEEAANINENALNLESQSTASSLDIPLWIMIMLGVLLLLFIILAVTLIVMVKKTKAKV